MTREGWSELEDGWLPWAGKARHSAKPPQFAERSEQNRFYEGERRPGLVILGLFARTLENQDDAFLQVSVRDCCRSGL